jgi:RNA polymerase sigma-70 factor (family 1)
LNILTEDRELVMGLKKGNINAFDATYSKYAKRLYAFGLKYMRSPVEAEELVQTIFLKLWENRHNLNVDFSFKAYLFTIAYNDICKYFRKKNYYQKFIIETLQENPHASYSIDEKINFQSIIEKVQQIVERLPEKQKKIFLKSKFEGKSAKEISDEIGLSPGTVDNYILEALKFIRHSLPKEELTLFVALSIFLP